MQCFSHGTILDTRSLRKFPIHFFGAVAQEHHGPGKMRIGLPREQIVPWGSRLGCRVLLAGLRPGLNYRLNSALCEFTTLPLLVNVHE